MRYREYYRARSERGRRMALRRWELDRERRAEGEEERVREMRTREVLHPEPRTGDVTHVLTILNVQSGEVRRVRVLKGKRADQVMLEGIDGRRSGSHGWAWVCDRLRRWFVRGALVVTAAASWGAGPLGSGGARAGAEELLATELDLSREVAAMGFTVNDPDPVVLEWEENPPADGVLHYLVRFLHLPSGTQGVAMLTNEARAEVERVPGTVYWVTAVNAGGESRPTAAIAGPGVATVRLEGATDGDGWRELGRYFLTTKEAPAGVFRVVVE